MCRRPLLVRRTVATVLALIVLGGCQMRVAVDVEVAEDGSGVVTAGVGLDAAASARAGDLETQLRVEDLTAAGWQVGAPTTEADGFTWVRASKPFADAEQAAAVLAELTGADGAFRDFAVTREEALLGTTTQVVGTVDLTQGPASFSDEELATALGGDPFGGTLAAIEAEEGRPIAEMVEFEVTVSLPGSPPEVYTPALGDAAPTVIDASSTTSSWLGRVWIWAVVAVVGLVVLVLLRRAFGRRR